jgi:hypothetical protein
MTYIIVYTISSSQGRFFIPVDSKSELAGEIEKIIKKGQGAKVKIYKTTLVNYKLKYKDKKKSIIEKIPEIEILP